MTQQDRSPLRLVAIIAAYNEEDIIGHVLAHLIEQGASVYLLDDGSTDRTIAVAQEFAGKGLIGVESLPPVGADEGTGRFCWSRILERKAQLAHTLDADWFIHQDADEFRDSPWPHLSLAEAVRLVDRLGWNAIDFEVFNFVPEDEEYEPDNDLRTMFRRYQPAADYDRAQVRCWKKTSEPVDLATTGGHEALFPGRRVFPIRFPMRHYPIRSAAHGDRKVFRDRKPRFDPGERARGWHVQYDQLVEGRPILPDRSSALLYDPEAANVALQVTNRLVEAACPSVRPDGPIGVAESVQHIEADIARQAEHVKDLALALEQRQRDIDALRAARDESNARLDASEARLKDALDQAAALDATAKALHAEVAQMDRNALDLARRLEEVFASRSWRITRPLRTAWRLLGRK